MVKEIIEFLSGVKMTAVSAICLLISLIGIIYGFRFVFNPAWLTVLISGLPILYKAFNKLVVCHCVSSSLLITIAMIAAIFIGEFFAAGEVALIMAVGEILEESTINKAKRGLGRLLELAPTTAHKLYIDGKEKTVMLENIQKGDILRVLAGETIPADGIIIKGSTSINQATLTGEALPVDKTIGDKVMAGTVNHYGLIEVLVENVQNSYLQKMINLVRRAENEKAPTQKIVDKWATVLVPSSLVIAFFTYIFTEEIIRAVTVLVVFCPCALVLATPTSIIAAIGRGTKHGVLIKSGAALEEMGKVDTIVFDKTGTLTTGEIIVSDIISVADSITTQYLLKLVSSVEKYSEHTLAKAIVRKSEENKISFLPVKNFQMIAGKGVTGNIDNHLLIAGNLNFIQELGITVTQRVQTFIQKFCKQGKAVIIIAYKNEVVGIIALSDSQRPEVPSVLIELKKQNIKTILLTGDNNITAKEFARSVGIKQFYADLLPSDKVEKIISMQESGNIVCMIGDGVNDAPALKASNVGIAMGNIGSDIAIDTADITLINDNIESLSFLKKLSNITVKTIKINITISMLLNLLGIILSICGTLAPITGAIMHNLGSVIVVLNAGRLYDKKL